MKSIDSDENNWNSFTNVANYHGRPYMCNNEWITAYIPEQNEPTSIGPCGCCIHG